VPWAPTIMSIIILTAVLSCLNSAFYVSSRVLFILAERGDAPQSFVRLNKRRVPVVSVLIGAAAGFLGIIAATEAPQKVFDFLVSASGAIMVFVYTTTSVAQIVLRRRREARGRLRRGWRRSVQILPCDSNNGDLRWIRGLPDAWSGGEPLSRPEQKREEIRRCTSGSD